MKKPAPLLLIPLLFTIGCATQPSQPAAAERKLGVAKGGRVQQVRTTAYTQTEPGGWHSACGTRLRCDTVHSAASDWSRFPVGTRFQIIQTGEICQIDDYGSALVGTNTIDLFKNSRAKMRAWGVRIVDIKILQWGSPTRSLEILLPRARNRHVGRMVDALRSGTPGFPARMRRVKS